MSDRSDPAANVAHAGDTHPDSRAGLFGLAVGALGIVYGDIGTSPLYALREAFDHNDLDVDTTSTYGVASIVFWALVIIISIKYLALVMRADNHGEGGILALTALLIPRRESGSASWRAARLTGVAAAAVTLGVFGTALLYGDGLITPAISVLSAVEGFEVATSAFADWVIPVSVVILVALFSVQSRGTAGIARVFGPVMVVWFAVVGVLGLRQVIEHPGVLEAVWPGYAVEFFVDNPGKAFLSLGSIFLVVTGGEALYADMGHFGRRPIVWSWYCWVFPALVLNYFGQAALLRSDPEAIENPFYRLGSVVGGHAAGDPGDDGHGDRLPGVDLRGLLDDGAGDPARLHPAPRRAPHVGRARRADLRAARQLAADARLCRSGGRLPFVERARLGLRDRGHGDDGDHHAAVLQGRPITVRLVVDEGGDRPAAAARRRPGVPRRQRSEDPPRRLVPVARSPSSSSSR